MNNLAIEAMAIVAGALETIGFSPQAVRTVRRGTAGDLSGWRLAIFAANTALWTIYGVLKQAWALAGSDGVVLVLVGVLLGYNVRDLRRLSALST